MSFVWLGHQIITTGRLLGPKMRSGIQCDLKDIATRYRIGNRNIITQSSDY